MKPANKGMHGRKTLSVSGGRVYLIGLRGAVSGWMFCEEDQRMTIRLFALGDEEQKGKMKPFELDRQGRFALPKEFIAGLAGEKTVVLVGMDSHWEIVKEYDIESDIDELEKDILSGDWFLEL